MKALTKKLQHPNCFKGCQKMLLRSGTGAGVGVGVGVVVVASATKDDKIKTRVFPVFLPSLPLIGKAS